MASATPPSHLQPIYANLRLLVCCSWIACIRPHTNGIVVRLLTNDPHLQLMPLMVHELPLHKRCMAFAHIITLEQYYFLQYSIWSGDKWYSAELAAPETLDSSTFLYIWVGDVPCVCVCVCAPRRATSTHLPYGTQRMLRWICVYGVQDSMHRPQTMRREGYRHGHGWIKTHVRSNAGGSDRTKSQSKRDKKGVRYMRLR